MIFCDFKESPSSASLQVRDDVRSLTDFYVVSWFLLNYICVCMCTYVYICIVAIPTCFVRSTDYLLSVC